MKIKKFNQKINFHNPKLKVIIAIAIVIMFIATNLSSIGILNTANNAGGNKNIQTFLHENNPQSASMSQPFINSISNIYATDTQNIYINGTGFGSNPELTSAGFGYSGCDTVYSKDSPSFAIMDGYTGNGLFDASCNWQAGFYNPNAFFSDSIGVFIKSWNNTNIVLTGFGDALGLCGWTISPGNEITVIIDNPAYPEIAYYNLTVSSTSANNSSNIYSLSTNSSSVGTGNATIESNTGQLTIISAVSSQPINNIYGFTNQYSNSSHIAVGELENTNDNNLFSVNSSSNYDATSIESVSISSSIYSPLGILSYNSDLESNQTNFNLSFNISAPGNNELLVIFTLGYTQVANGFCQNYGVNVNGIATKGLNGTAIQVDQGVWSSISVNYFYLNSSGKYSVNSVVSSTDGSIELLGFVISQNTNYNYGVTFTETGLKSGTSWSVTLNDETESSTTQTIVFSEPNGTYSYLIGYVFGNVSSPSSGSLTVSGKPVSVNIIFSSTISDNYLIYDNFISDNYINTTKWSMDSTVLANITNVDSKLFGWPITLVSPNDFSYRFDNGLSLYPNNGATSSVYDNMAGFTSNTIFTYPVAVNVNFTINDMSGGNSMIILSNATGGNMIGVLLGPCLYVQDGAKNPTDTYYNINPNVEYHLSIFVENSKFTIDISGDGKYFENFSYSPNGNQTLYLTFGSYIGTVPGEQITHTEAQAIKFQNISVSSKSVWNLTVSTYSSSGNPDSGVDVTVINAFTNKTLSELTPSNGTVRFEKLNSGQYYVIASQTQDKISVTDTKYVFIGESYNPSLFDIALSIKIIPPPPSKLSTTISSLNSTQAEAPWKNTFVATPSGYVQNYSYKWYINDKYAGSGYEINDTFYNPSGTGSTSYTICLNVSSQGSWFGTLYSRQIANISIEQIVYSEPLCLNLTEVSKNQYAEISFGTNNDMAVGYIKGTTLYLKFNITDLFLKNTIPGWLMDIIGVSYPYWGVNISDKAGNDNNMIDVLQPGTSACLRELPLPGSINSITQLLGFTFDVTLNPGAVYAIIGDIVQIVLSAVGVISALSVLGSLSTTIIEALVDDLVLQVAHATAVNSLNIFTGSSVNIEAAIVSSFTGFLEDIIPAIPHILYSLLKSYVKDSPEELESLGSLSSTLSENIDNIFPAWKIFDLGFDIGAVIGAAVVGDLTTQYEIENYQNSINYCVTDPGGSLPDVEILNKNGDTGWDGTWVGSRYSHSSFTNSGYAFSLPSNGISTLEISNPSVISSLQYNITVSVGNDKEDLMGTLAPGSNVKYIVSSNSTSFSLTKEYKISFITKNLPSDTQWFVTLNGTMKSSTSNIIVFNEPNGTYTYKVNAPSGYILSPSSGTITLNGNNITKEITFKSNKTSILSNTELYEIIGAAAVIAAIGGAVMFIRRRK